MRHQNLRIRHPHESPEKRDDQIINQNSDHHRHKSQQNRLHQKLKNQRPARRPMHLSQADLLRAHHPAGRRQVEEVDNGHQQDNHTDRHHNHHFAILSALKLAPQLRPIEIDIRKRIQNHLFRPYIQIPISSHHILHLLIHRLHVNTPRQPGKHLIHPPFPILPDGRSPVRLRRIDAKQRRETNRRINRNIRHHRRHHIRIPSSPSGRFDGLSNRILLPEKGLCRTLDQHHRSSVRQRLVPIPRHDRERENIKKPGIHRQVPLLHIDFPLFVPRNGKPRLHPRDIRDGLDLRHTPGNRRHQGIRRRPPANLVDLVQILMKPISGELPLDKQADQHHHRQSNRKPQNIEYGMKAMLYC